VFSSSLLFLIASLLNTDVCLDDNAEARSVNAHLSAPQTHANSVIDNFRADRSKAQTLIVLQDQISQATALAETCRAALATIHQVMLPLNDQPSSLPDLLRRFENGEAIYRFVRQHLRCGALVALSFMRVHYPEVNMKLVKTLPPTPSGRTDMTAHYTACGRAADCIAVQIIDESIKERAGRNPPAA
jgi:hypothetical protein